MVNVFLVNELADGPDLHEPWYDIQAASRDQGLKSLAFFFFVHSWNTSRGQEQYDSQST